MGKWSLRSALVFGLLSTAPGCGSDGYSPPPVDVRAPEHLIQDAGADAGRDPVTRCCRLDNARGERLDYKCSAGAAFDVGYLEGRGYRCWIAE